MIHGYGNVVKGNCETIDDYCMIKNIGDYVVFMIADGNGGKPGMVNIGNLAVSLVLDYLEKIIDENTSIIDIRNKLENGIYTASKSFLTVNAISEQYSDIYASLSVMIVNNISLDMVFASIGNTEIQLFRNGKFVRMNRVHSESYQLLEKGEIPESEFYAHPKRRILTSALGIFDKPEIDIISSKLKPDDILFMATDGIYLTLTPDDVFKEMVSHEGSDNELQAGVEGVLKKTVDNGGQDNAGMICLFIS